MLGLDLPWLLYKCMWEPGISIPTSLYVTYTDAEWLLALWTVQETRVPIR